MFQASELHFRVHSRSGDRLLVSSSLRWYYSACVRFRRRFGPPDRLHGKVPPSSKEQTLAQSASNPKETLVGIVVLAALALIAAGMFVKQSRFDPADYAVTANGEGAQPAQESSGAAALGAKAKSSSPPLLDALPEGLSALTPVETFDPETLSEKIDGKAELYLSAGFKGLQSQRFGSKKGPDAWIEVYLYDMGDGRNAFSVYSAQRRADAEKIDLAPFAYRTSNALFFILGRQYVEIVGAAEGLDTELFALGKAVAAKGGGGETTEVKETDLFPKDQLDEGSVTLHAADVFGLDVLNNTFTASYKLGEAELTAFLSLRKTPEEAKELASAYHKFLIDNGGKDVQWSAEAAEGGSIVEIMDSFEVIFTNGRVFAGVHEAENKDSAEKLALMLAKSLKEAGK